MAKKRDYIGSTVGLVEGRTLKLELPDGGLRLERGGVLPEVTVAYEICGNVRDEMDNVVFICHALTGDAHVAGRHAEGEEPDGWWEGMVGSRRSATPEWTRRRSTPATYSLDSTESSVWYRQRT